VFQQCGNHPHLHQLQETSSLKHSHTPRQSSTAKSKLKSRGSCWPREEVCEDKTAQRQLGHHRNASSPACCFATQLGIAAPSQLWYHPAEPRFRCKTRGTGWWPISLLIKTPSFRLATPVKKRHRREATLCGDASANSTCMLGLHVCPAFALGLVTSIQRLQRWTPRRTEKVWEVHRCPKWSFN